MRKIVLTLRHNVSFFNPFFVVQKSNYKLNDQTCKIIRTKLIILVKINKYVYYCSTVKMFFRIFLLKKIKKIIHHHKIDRYFLKYHCDIETNKYHLHISKMGSYYFN